VKHKHVYLNLFLIDFPITAITSIMHRISGIILFFFIPFLLYFFKLALESGSSFYLAKLLIVNFLVKFVLYIILVSFIYHFISGLKHMVMDCGFFDNINSSRKLSFISIVLTIFLFFFILII
jgi:succinate dehydrogenase / fumarate reductase cytochrome b subunit